MPEFKPETIQNTTYALGCSKEMAIEVLREIERQKKIAVGNFIYKIRKDIKNKSNHRVINGKAPKELREAFREGEEIGRELMRELSLEIINDANVLTDETGGERRGKR